MTGDLFATADPPASGSEALGPGAFLLHGFAAGDAPALWAALQPLLAQAPLRHMITPSGHRMSVAMTNCGALGWISDRAGYRYEPGDPQNGRPWPPMPALFRRLAQAAAARAGFPDFQPDACLINRYAPEARLSLHQDRDERDLSAPIVSVSLGLPVIFLWGGLKRQEPRQRIRLEHGDVVVWGGPDRLRYHGVLPLQAGHHALLGEQRLNLTFRQAR
ncbi:MAG: DNA oxidative demethylase AlkB [Candidatus Competibacteraceae bacterium]|nr:DNA oxidative demethylase AlkB [Candidatus Competibacteraceae bacterium]MCB1819990.1 DNA oxidative demethylase AlkB [Candidatus Competibacteraceae bacterium]